LHARRSANDIAAWARTKGTPTLAPGLAVVLTGTDLYRDIVDDPNAQQSLDRARRLVVLQECGPTQLPLRHRAKTTVIFQSTRSRQPVEKTHKHLRVVMVGHLRDEKLPQTLFETAHLLSPQSGILIDHIGDPLDVQLAAQARQTAADCPHYRWLGGLNHEATRHRIQRAHLLVHASKMEGGAHVVMEAVCSGTPVLASRIDGNVGMLGQDYSGYFDVGNAEQLAVLLSQIRSEQNVPATGAEAGVKPKLLETLTRQCRERAHLFAPETEKAALKGLVNHLLKDMNAGYP
jgi:putative glycosyltransferase (TIGR04348 family)